MRFRLGFALGFGAGYVLGTKAGRERYEHIRTAAIGLWDSAPGRRIRETAAGAAGRAQGQAGDKLRALRHRPIDLTETAPARAPLRMDVPAEG